MGRPFSDKSQSTEDRLRQTGENLGASNNSQESPKDDNLQDQALLVTINQKNTKTEIPTTQPTNQIKTPQTRRVTRSMSKQKLNNQPAQSTNNMHGTTPNHPINQIKGKRDYAALKPMDLAIVKMTME